jgi:DNA topoisomerase-1
MSKLPETTPSPVQSAVDSRLSYVTDRRPGISRVAAGKRFRYYDARGRLVRDRATLARIEALVIPPAWTGVWICPVPGGHLQATGRDARGRKQYRYHPWYRAAREESKYEKLVAFGHCLPRIRRRVRRDLRLPGLPEDKVIATVVRLMDVTNIRIGNQEYARQNQSFGLTTLRDRHVRVNGSRIHFQFNGKSGKTHEIDVNDRQLARIVKRSRDLPGYELFQYLDEKGDRVALESGMVNRYLRDVAGRDVTAKDFRTWHGTVCAAQNLSLCGPAASETQAKKNVVAAVKAVSERLGNRPATCRKHYIHPAVVALYEGGRLQDQMEPRATRDSAAGLDSAERCVLKLLESS